MATTGEETFSLCMALIDEYNDNGTVDATATIDYRAKTPALLTIMVTELARKEGVESSIITDLADDLVVSDYTARVVLPYGLAAHLMLDENPSVASFFNQKFEEMKRNIPVAFEAITDVYGWSE